MKLRSILTVALLVGAAACGGDGDGPVTPVVTPPVVTPPAPPVPPPTVAGLEIEIKNPKVIPGQAVTLGAIALDSGRVRIPAAVVTWVSADTTKATVNAAGVLTARAVGETRITATSGAISVSTLATIVDGTLGSWPDTVSIPATGTRLLRARVIPRDESRQYISAPVWKSSNPAVARVEPTGLVTAVGGGRATITATVGSREASTDVTVFSYPRPLRFASISSGEAEGEEPFACGVTVEGDGYCWGADEVGQLGTGTPRDRCDAPPPNVYLVGLVPSRCAVLPAPVAGGMRWEMISAGGRHACGIAVGGKGYCWGSMATLEKPLLQQRVPTPIAGGIVFRTISAGEYETCGVSTANVTYCWLASEEVYGTGSGPKAVPGDLAFTSIDVGRGQRCGIVADGTAYCWGDNFTGQLGIDRTDRSVPTPTRVAGDLRFRSIHANQLSTCAITLEGKAYCWGTDIETGLGRSGTTRAPTAVVGDLTFTSFDAGNGSSCGLIADGNVYCWGRNVYFPNGASDYAVKTPVVATPAFALSKMSVGSAPPCAITADQYAYCFRQRYGGELGIR